MHEAILFSNDFAYYFFFKITLNKANKNKQIPVFGFCLDIEISKL